MAESCQRLARRPADCPIFGMPKRMTLSVLPTVEDLLMDYQWVRLDLRTQPKKEPTVSEITVVLANKVKEIWTRASIATVSTDRINQLVRFHHDKYLKLIRYPVCKRNDQYQQKVSKFRDDARQTLFDIASCKCVDPASCKCAKEKKVPPEEREFLHDQRTARQRMIGNTDGPRTKALMLKGQRKETEAARLAADMELAEASTSKPDEVVDWSGNSSSSETDVDTGETDYCSFESISVMEDVDDSELAAARSQQRLRLSNTAKASDRHAVSDRAAAEIASSVLVDYGVITSDDFSEVIDRSKIRRERHKYRESLRAESANSSTDLRGLYFDGRKDKTLTQEQAGGTFHRRTVTEEHVSLIQEPDSIYLGHTTPVRGSADCIKQTILDFFETKNINVQNLAAVGCDGTAVNTGRKGGTIRLLEQHLKRPLQWFVCLFHSNELPLRHLFEHLDGSTSGPRSYSGPVGTSLQQCDNMPVVEFQRMECDLPELPDSVVHDLSTDQRYLYDMCRAVASGTCSEALSHRIPGKLVMSRWLTMATRVLRLYVATKEPSNTLMIITEFILKVYAPVWFAIKSKSSCKDGARHLWMLINKSRYLREDLKSIVDPVIQRNAFYAHHENLLLALLTDDRKHIRELGLRRIMRARASKKPQRDIRMFEVPVLKFDAADYIDLIDWQSCELTEPPLTKDITDNDLEQLVHSVDSPAVAFPRFPCHTQAVERCVKAVTESALSVIGEHARDGFIRARFSARKIMPVFETKSDFRTG